MLNIKPECYELCKHVFKAVAMILDMDADYFTEPVKQVNPQLRLLHSMPVDRDTVEAEGRWRINPHSGMFLSFPLSLYTVD